MTGKWNTNNVDVLLLRGLAFFLNVHSGTRRDEAKYHTGVLRILIAGFMKII